MKKATPESKDILNPTETIEYFGLSRRKFYSLLSEKKETQLYRSLRQQKADY